MTKVNDLKILWHLISSCYCCWRGGGVKFCLFNSKIKCRVSLIWRSFFSDMNKATYKFSIISVKSHRPQQSSRHISSEIVDYFFLQCMWGQSFTNSTIWLVLRACSILPIGMLTVDGILSIACWVARDILSFVANFHK